MIKGLLNSEFELVLDLLNTPTAEVMEFLRERSPGHHNFNLLCRGFRGGGVERVGAGC